MDENQLATDLAALRQEVEKINRVLDPLLARRERLTQRINAIHEMMRPLGDPPTEILEAARIAVDQSLSPRRAFLEDAVLAHNLDAWLGGTPIEIKSLRLPPRYLRTRVDSQADGSSASASRVIADTLEAAGRPLHKTEIFLRSSLHPLGPINGATMTTRLSRDRELFERVQGRGAPVGFWALRAWPDDKKKDIRLVGSRYAETVTRLARELEGARRLRQGAANVERRLLDLRITDATDSIPPEATGEVDRRQRHLRFYQSQLRRRDAIIHELWETVTAMRRELGEEAQTYPPIPAIAPTPDREPSPDQATQPLPLFTPSEDEGVGAGEKGGER